MNSENILSFMVLLLSASLGWCQAPETGSPTIAPATQYPEQRMSIPAPINDNGYSLSLSEVASGGNHMSGGTTFGGSNEDNVWSTNSNPIADFDYYISPWIALARSSARTRWSLEYSPRFTMYKRVTSLDRTDHDVNADFEYRIAPYASIRFEDSFTKSSNLLDQIGGRVALADLNLLQYRSVSIIPPLADVLMNRVSVEYRYQFGQNDMIGADFKQVDLRYPNRSQAAGLYDSTSQASEGFYSRRISSTEYMGALFRYEKLSAFPDNHQTDVQGIVFFYSAALFRELSLSISAGPEHSTTYQSTFGSTSETLRTWTPAVAVGLRWQGDRTGIAANFTKRIESGGGLLGAVRANTIDVSTRCQISRSTSVQFAAVYSDNTTLDLNTLATGTSGHRLLASTSLERQLREHLMLQIGYGMEQQRYAWVPISSRMTTRNRSWISLSYQFERPLGGT